MKKALVIGAGISGLASAIRMAVNGFQVTVFEVNKAPGGKLSEEENNGFRFDMGPSLFTMPQYVDELFLLAGKNPRFYFNYQKLDTICTYFYPSGTHLQSFFDIDKRINNYAQVFNESKVVLERYFKYSQKIYEITHNVFLENSLHSFDNYFKKETLSAALQIGKIDAFRTQHEANSKFFKNGELVQLFDRYATYNGSNPYQAPATLNVIPHFENGFGAYFPDGGMISITKSLYQLAKDLGVQFYFETSVTQIKVQKGRAVGVQTALGFFEADVVFSNVDIWYTYQHLLNQSLKMPRSIQKQERSSSALIFYWGMDTIFEELGLHNIFFSADYQKEFISIFQNKTVCDDPTVYINITSKFEKQDAPDGGENWFVMINVPHNSGQNWEVIKAQAKENIISKLELMLGKSIRSHIKQESVLEPKSIESLTGSYLGSLYGSSSNGKFSAFLRHPNFISKVKNLYVCGGSVHPGGGIPLALLSAKIAVNQCLKSAV